MSELTEERIREIFAEEISKIGINVSVSCNGYGDVFYVSSTLTYDGNVISEGSDSFSP